MIKGNCKEQWCSLVTKPYVNQFKKVHIGNKKNNFNLN